MTLEYSNTLSPYTMLVKSLRTSSASQASENILLLQHLMEHARLEHEQMQK